MTTFQVGDSVRSKSNCQGLVLGTVYTVVDVAVVTVLGCDYCTYTLQDDAGCLFPVNNLQFLARRVSRS